MKYMLLIYGTESGWTEDQRRECMVESMGICDELAEQGKYIASAPLHPVATATSVRVRDGKPWVTSGPFAETAEQLGGYYLIDVPNLDEAIAIASRLPPAKKGTVEIRPLRELHGLPAPKAYAGQGTHYIFLCYDDEAYWTRVGELAHQAAMNEAVGLAHRVDARGQYLSAAPLHSPSVATSVRVRDGQRLLTDGPFAETREILGGFYVIAAPGLDEAVAIAAEHPGARVGGVEIRPVFDVTAIDRHDPREIVSDRELPFARDRVFDAIRDPARLARWWGPAGFANTFHEFDFRPGGQWRFVMHGPNGANYDNHSEFETISAPSRIVLQHRSAPRFRMTMQLAELAGIKPATRLEWRMRFEDQATRDQLAPICIPANQENFDRLAAELSR